MTAHDFAGKVSRPVLNSKNSETRFLLLFSDSDTLTVQRKCHPLRFGVSVNKNSEKEIGHRELGPISY
jgi:hypothetical protein